MAKDNYQSKVYSFLVRTNRIDPQETGYESFVNQMSNQNYLNQIYNVLKEEQKSGRLGTLKGYNEFSTEFSTTTTPTTTTETEVVAEEETPQQGTPARRMSPIPQALVQRVQPQTNQPQPTPEETQIAPIDQQAGQVQGGMPQGKGLGAGQFQITDIRTQAEKPQTVPTMPRMEPIQQTTTTPTGQATPLTTPPPQQVGYFDYLGNAVERGLNRGEIADYISATGKTPTAEEFARIAELNAENERLFTSKAMQDFSNNPDLESTLKSLPEIAIESIASLYRHGLARMGVGAVAGGVAGSVIPVAGTLVGAGTGALSGMSVAGLGLEVSGTIMEGLNELKIDTKNPEALKTAFSNPAVMDYLKQKAYARGIPIAALDAVSMGVAGTLLGKPVASAVSRGLKVLGEAVIQGVFGAGGEFLAELNSGEKIKGYEILAEGLAEIPGSIPEVGIAVLSKNKGAGKDTKVESARLALKSPDMPIDAINESIDVGVGTGEISATQATELKQEVAKAREINAKIPAEIKDTELRVAAIGLIEERDNLNAQLETVDEAFKPAIQEKIKGINEQLQELSQIPQQQGTQAFFETNQPSQTNPLLRLPESVDAVMDKIDQGVLVSAESLFDVYNSVQTAIRETLANRAITPEERSATINILSGMLTDIDRANTEGQRFVEQVEEVSVQDRVPAVREGVKPLPQGQAPKGTATPSISQAKAIREENRRKQAGTTTLPSSGQTIITPAPATTEVATEAVTETPTGTTAEAEVKLAELPTKTIEAEVVSETPVAVTDANPALADVESTAKALEGVDVEGEILRKTNVVDDSNKPLRLYHGTNADFDDFEVTKSSRIVLMNPHDVETKAFFFHPDVEFAKSFGSKIKEVKLNVKKLANNHLSDLIASIKETWGSAGSVETANNGNIYFEDYEGDSWINKMADKDGIDWMLLESPEFIKNLENRGIDGTGVWEDDNSISYAVFNAKNIIQKKDPKQLSSAYHKAKQDGSNPELVQAVEKLLTPTQDAVQKQTAGQVPVQSGTTSSQEVAKGEPQAEPQSTADKGQAKATATQEEIDTTPDAEVATEQAPAKKTLSEEFGISADDVNNLVEQKRKTFEGYSVEMALQELGVPQDKIADALPVYVAEMLEGTLPTKSPTKKQKISEDLIPEGEIKIQPIPSKGKGKHAKTTEEKIDLVSDATDNKSTRDYAKVVHKNADNKEVVATDAHVMIVVKDDSITETESVDVKTGQKADVRYPDYKSVIPDAEKRKDKKRVNAKTIYDLASGIAKATKMFTGRIIPARIVIGDTELFVPAENLKRGLEPFVRSGITDIEISVDGPNRAIVFKGGDITSIVMPVEYKGENAGYTTIISEEQATPTTTEQATAQTTPTTETTATTTTTEVTLNTPNETTIKDIEKIENATEKGRELALSKPVNKWVKRAFDSFQDLSFRAKKAGIYDGTTLKIGGKEYTVDTPAKFKAFLAQSQANFDAINEAVKDIPSEQKTDTNPSPKTVEEKSKEVFNDAKSTFVFPIGLNPKFKFDSRLPENVVRFFKKYFRPRGLWTKGMFSEKRRMENQISAQVQKSEFLVRDLRNAVKEAYPKGVTQEQLQAMNDVLQGMPREIPANLYAPLTKMREHIDELSQMMISEGIIDEKLVPVFDANMGIYTTRTYAIHNDPKSWLNYIENEPEGQQIRNNAVNYIRQATEAKADRLDKFADENEKRAEKLFRRSELAEGDEALMLQAKADEVIARADKQRELARTMREQDFDAQIEAFLFAEGQPLDVVRKGNVGAKDLGVLKKRKNIPDAIRALMGEEKDPLTNYTMSVAKMSALIANNQFLNEVKAQGVTDGLFTKTPQGKNTVQIASASTDSMSPLNGLYTTKDIAEAFKEFDANTKSPWYIDAMLWFNAAVKVNKTVLSQGTHIRNFISNPIIELANGYIPTLKGKAIDSQMEQILNRRFGDKEKLRDYIIKLTELGVLGQGGNYRDILSVYEDLKGNKYDYQKLIEPKITGAAKKSWNIAQKVYKGGDEFWKVVAFENERAVLEKAYGDTKTSEELDQMAADIIRKTRVDYSMVPKAVKAINKIPFTGTFVTFPAEVLRIGFNIPTVAYEEMNSGNKVIREHGIKRMAGYLTAMTLPYGVKELAKYLLGMDDEEEEARKKFLAPWAQNSTLIWIGKDRYIDTGFSDAFSILKKPIVAFSRGKSAAEGALNATKEFLGPVISEEIGYKTLKNVSDNTDEFGNPIYDENADAGTIYTQVSTYVLKQVEPGTVSQARRLYLGETGALSEKGQQYRTGDEVLNAVFGIKPVTINWDNAVSYKFRDAVEGINNSNKFFLKKSKELRKDDKEGRRKAAESTNLAVENAYNDLREYYTSALKIGMIPQKVDDIMKQSGVPKELAYAVKNNTGYKNYIIVLNDGTVIDRNTQRLLRGR
jgi:hypothetical protein